MRLYQEELAQPRMSRGIMTFSTWPIFMYFRSLIRLFLKLFNDEAVTVSWVLIQSSKLFHKFIICSEKKCRRNLVWKLFFNVLEWPLVRILVSSSKKESIKYKVQRNCVRKSSCHRRILLYYCCIAVLTPTTSEWTVHATLQLCWPEASNVNSLLHSLTSPSSRRSFPGLPGDI